MNFPYDILNSVLLYALLFFLLLPFVARQITEAFRIIEPLLHSPRSNGPTVPLDPKLDDGDLNPAYDFHHETVRRG